MTKLTGDKSIVKHAKHGELGWRKARGSGAINRETTGNQIVFRIRLFIVIVFVLFSSVHCRGIPTIGI